MLARPATVASGRAEQRWARVLAAAALLTAAGLHLVQVPGFTPPVLDGLFVAAAAGTVLGAALLLGPAPRLGWLIGGGTAFLSFLAYVLTRTTGLPGILTAIGNWFYPLGVPTLVVEGVAFLLAAWALSDRSALNVEQVASELRATRGVIATKGGLGRGAES